MAGHTRKRKIAEENRGFKECWTNEFFFVEDRGNIICLICNEKVSWPKRDCIKRHYEAKHSKDYNGLAGPQREDKAKKLMNKLGSQQNLFSKAATEASFKVAAIIARRMKPFSDGEFVKECMLAALDVMCPEKVLRLRASRSLALGVPDSAASSSPFHITTWGNGELESSCDGTQGPAKEEPESSAHNIDIVKEEIEDLEEEQRMDEPGEKEDNHSQVNTATTVTSFPPLKPPKPLELPQPRKKKRTLGDDKPSTVPESPTTTTTSSSDEFHQFGLTVAAQLRAMPLRAALETQLEIQKIITAKRFQLM